MLPTTAALLRGTTRRQVNTLSTLNTARFIPTQTIRRTLPFASRFSTQPARRSTQQSGTPKPESAEQAAVKDTRSFAERYTAALDELGVSKNLRVVLFILLSIFGTMETWFWCKAIYVWHKGGKVQSAHESN